jgi:two-component system, NarL family, response regulator DesR
VAEHTRAENVARCRSALESGRLAYRKGPIGFRDGIGVGSYSRKAAWDAELNVESNVLLVATNERLQDAISGLLRRDASVSYLGSCRTPRDALSLLSASAPAVVVAESPPHSVDDVLDWREVRGFSARILVLSTYFHDADVVRSIIAGASGHVLAEAGHGRELIDAIGHLASGQLLLPADLVDRLRAIAADQISSRLDATERTVLGLITDGRTDQEIASSIATDLGRVRSSIGALVGKLT